MRVDCSRVSFAWYLNHGKCLNTFLFLLSNKMLVIRARIHKMLARIFKGSLIWVCTVCQAKSVRNFRASTELHISLGVMIIFGHTVKLIAKSIRRAQGLPRGACSDPEGL